MNVVFYKQTMRFFLEKYLCRVHQKCKIPLGCNSIEDGIDGEKRIEEK